MVYEETREYLARKAEQDRLRAERGDERMRDSEDDSDCGAAVHEYVDDFENDKDAILASLAPLNQKSSKSSEREESKFEAPPGLVKQSLAAD